MLFLETYRFRMSAFELDIQKDSRMDGTMPSKNTKELKGNSTDSSAGVGSCLW